MIAFARTRSGLTRGAPSAIASLHHASREIWNPSAPALVVRATTSCEARANQSLARQANTESLELFDQIL